MSKQIEFGNQHILNSDEIKYYYLDENKENITIVFKDGERLNLNPDTKIKTVKAWERILKSCGIDPACWVYEAIYNLDVKVTEEL